MPEFLCAICYDENDCDADDWDQPLDIPITETDYKLKGKPKGGIESCSVRKGCTLTLVDTDKVFKSEDVVLKANGRDEHFNLNGNADKKLDKMSNDAEIVRCACFNEQYPTFSLGTK